MNTNIPNICHFIFGLQEQTDDFLFAYYISVYSAFIINVPDRICFYYHYQPKGIWWEELKKIPNIQFEIIDIPTHIGDKQIKKTAHRADWARMNILYDRGGIYLDIDTICAKPWSNLLNNNVVLGKQTGRVGICNAIMFTKPRSDFFKMWLDNYEEYFCPNGWNESSIDLPYTLSLKYPDLLLLKEADVFFLPSFYEIRKIFCTDNEIPTNLISLHLWEKNSITYLSDIKDWSWASENSHTLYGKLLLQLLDFING